MARSGRHPWSRISHVPVVAIRVTMRIAVVRFTLLAAIAVASLRLQMFCRNLVQRLAAYARGLPGALLALVLLARLLDPPMLIIDGLGQTHDKSVVAVQSPHAKTLDALFNEQASVLVQIGPQFLQAPLLATQGLQRLPQQHGLAALFRLGDADDGFQAL